MLSGILYLMWVRKIAAERGKRLDAMTNYSSLIENMPILYAKEELIYDAEGHIIDFIYREVNPIFEKYIISKNKIIGRSKANSASPMVYNLSICTIRLTTRENLLSNIMLKKSKPI